MLEATLSAANGAHALIMAAAVADFRPAQVANQKIKKQSGFSNISLEPTADILRAVASQRQQTGSPSFVVGFAAESQELAQNARGKLQAKRLDMIVANDITAPDAGFEVNTNRVSFYFADGRTENLPILSKDEVAAAIIDRIIMLEQAAH
jgi:phosphopantothenoylcysteine decarboxylase/phosphopantothenate--cysteine ligase